MASNYNFATDMHSINLHTATRNNSPAFPRSNFYESIRSGTVKMRLEISGVSL